MLDIILLIALAIAALKGWRSGFLSMILGLAVMILAALLASQFATMLGSALGVGNAYLRPVIGFVVIFCVILAIGSQVRRLFRPKRGLLRGLDGALGAGVGVVRGAFILSVVFVLLRLVNLPSETARESSVLYPIVLKTSTTVVTVLRPYAHIPERDTTV